MEKVERREAAAAKARAAPNSTDSRPATSNASARGTAPNSIPQFGDSAQAVAAANAANPKKSILKSNAAATGSANKPKSTYSGPVGTTVAVAGAVAAASATAKVTASQLASITAAANTKSKSKTAAETDSGAAGDDDGTASPRGTIHSLAL